MSDKKISELTALTAPDGAEELVVNDSGTSKKITQTNLLSTALPLAGGTMTGTVAGFTSTGIDDNATSTAITIGSDERVTIDSTAGTDTLTLNRNGGTNGWVTMGFPSAKFEVDVKSAMKVAIDGTQKLYIHSGGLAFNGDTAAANSLDDYETGTRTASSVGGITATTNTVTGSYTKIGRFVTEHIIVTITGKSSGTGNPYINLTFTPSGSMPSTYMQGGSLGRNSIVSSVHHFGVYGAGAVVYANTIGGSYIGHASWSDGVLGFTVIYETA